MNTIYILVIVILFVIPAIVLVSVFWGLAIIASKADQQIEIFYTEALAAKTKAKAVFDQSSFSNRAFLGEQAHDGVHP